MYIYLYTYIYIYTYIHKCLTPCAPVWHPSVIRVTSGIYSWRILTCGVTCSYVWHEGFIRVTCIRHTYTPAAMQAAAKGCFQCGTLLNLTRCGKCLNVTFCGQKCLLAGWPAHKIACKALRVAAQAAADGGCEAWAGGGEGALWFCSPSHSLVNLSMPCGYGPWSNFPKLITFGSELVVQIDLMGVSGVEISPLRSFWYSIC